MCARRTGAGRPGALDTARELVTLVSSLSEAGDALSSEAVAERLGVDEGEAEKLVELVLSSQLVGGGSLPLVEDGDAYTLVTSNGIRGRRLRLGRDETLALSAALERLGVGDADPLRLALEESLSAEPVDEALVRRLVSGESGSDTLATTLAACGRAAVGRRELVFSYKKPGDATAGTRRVLPLALRSEDDVWFLDALDLDRDASRTFRVDRMADAVVGPRASTENPTREAREERPVCITFTDRSVLDLLPWHDLRVVKTLSDGSLVAETPFYGGTWLPRMIAACGGTARCDDPEITALVRAYALGELSS